MLIFVLILSVTACKKEQPLTEGQKLRKEFTIMIDPAHGGKDPGATSVDGIAEKTIVLDFSQRIAKHLTEAGFGVQLTRNKDMFKSLSERVHQSELSGADIQISIHTNNSSSPDSSGFMTYYQEKNPQSKILDSLVHAEYQKISVMKDLGSRNAKFFILEESDIPAILVEVGYLSNIQDTNLITDPVFQEKFALTITTAIESYYLKEVINQ